MRTIGILIPCTSKGRQWKTLYETYLFNLTLRTIINTISRENKLVFYIGIDDDDVVFSKKDVQNQLIDLVDRTFGNDSIQFISMSSVEKGHLTKMWNILFRKAYDDMCDFFFQCGDDISFETKGWDNDCIKTLGANNNIGVTGPRNNNPRILTQTFVSRKHMDIFGFYFPESIRNWCCDDWICEVYSPKNYFPLQNHFCSNNGGPPRYTIGGKTDFNDDDLVVLRNKLKTRLNRDKQLIEKYIAE